MDATVMADSRIRAMVEERFYSIPRAMLTLVSYITMDSLSALYEPLIDANPWLIIYFMPMIVVISIATMNVILANLLENAITSVESDKQRQLDNKRKTFQRLKPMIGRMFDEIDTDGTGTVTMQEVSEGHLHLPDELKDKISIPTILDLFYSIDTDKSGTISRDEWEESLLFLALHEVPAETTRMLQLIRRQHKKLSHFDSRLKAIADGLVCLTERQNAFMLAGSVPI